VSGGTRQMFYCEALAGVSCVMAPGRLTMPPTLNEAQQQHDIDPAPSECSLPDPRCDSVSGETQGSRVTVIYDNGRVLPRFLITFKAES
jgi:hypothetical protein